LTGNESRLDQPIPKICGRREINPPFAAQPYFEYLPKVGESDIHLDNEQYFYALYAVGIGNHEVIAKIGNTPITRFADVLSATYLPPGTAPTTVLANVTSAAEVSTQILESGRYVGGFVACAAERTCAFVGVDIVATRGLGKTGALTVSWQVESRPINDFGQVLGAWSVLGSETRSAFTSTPQRWSSKYAIGTPARLEVRVVRTDVQDTDPQALHEIAWTGLRAYLAEPAPLNAHTAHYELVLRASGQLSQGASRDLRLICSALTRTLNGSLAWQVESVTRNGAWWALELATSMTWGMRKPDTRVDLQSFYDLAQTAEARQDRFDYVFESTTNAWDALQIIAKSMRARAFRRNGVISIARDEIADIPITAFTPRNCQPGMSVGEKLRNRKTADGVVVEYQDHRTWEWTSIACPVPGVAVGDIADPIIVHLDGVTGATHAHREGLYEAANLLYRPRTAAWTTEMQGMLPAYMSPVDFLADIEGYGFSGDVAFWTVSTLTMGLSDPPDFSAGTLYLTLIRDDGTCTDPVVVTPGAGSNDVILPAAPDFTLRLDDGTRERPKYLIGAKDLVKVVSIEDGGKTDQGAQLYALHGVIDDERVHTADVALLPGPGVIQDPVGDPDDSDESTGGGGLLLIVNLRDHPAPDVIPGDAGGTGSGALARFHLHNDGTGRLQRVVYESLGGLEENYTDEWMRFTPIEVSTAALYECRATIIAWSTDPGIPPSGSGTPLTFTDGTAGAWLNLATSRSWGAGAAAYPSHFVRIIFTLEIREVSTGIVQDTATISLQAVEGDV
jgi:hypothetical protein